MGIFGDIFGTTGAKAAKKAAEYQMQMTRENRAFQEKTLNAQLGLNRPYLDTGYDAVNDLRTIAGYAGLGYRPDYSGGIDSLAGGAASTSVPVVPIDQARADLQARFEASPIYRNLYKSAIDEGTEFLERRAKARGGLNSGSTLRGIAEYAGQLGSQTWNQFQNTISQMAGMGQNASGTSQNALQAAGNSIGQTYSDQGNAYAQGKYNAAQSRQSAWGNILGAAGTIAGAAAGNPAAFA